MGVALHVGQRERVGLDVVLGPGARRVDDDRLVELPESIVPAPAGTTRGLDDQTLIFRTQCRPGRRCSSPRPSRPSPSADPRGRGRSSPSPARSATARRRGRRCSRGCGRGRNGPACRPWAPRWSASLALGLVELVRVPDPVLGHPGRDVARAAPEDEPVRRLVEPDDDVRRVADTPGVLPFLGVLKPRVVGAEAARPGARRQDRRAQRRRPGGREPGVARPRRRPR